jgi:mannitol/fructose-specific phosphotransferase system IIA component (Ntr-type)/DNA-binding Xre family transcriptional regulator
MRTSKGMSLRHLARQIGLSPTYLSQVETGKVPPPNHKRIQKIEEILDIPEGCLLDLTDRLDPRMVRYLNETPGATAFLRTAQETGITESDFLDLTELVRAEGPTGMRRRLSLNRGRRHAPRRGTRSRRVDERPLTICHHLRKDLIVLRSRARTKEEALGRVLSEVQKVYPACERECTLEDVLERERLASTGIGSGIAIPRLVTEGVKRTAMGIFRFPAGVPFDAVDGEPVHLLFFLVGPHDQNGLHLKMLARITRLLNHGTFKDRLLSARTIEELLSLFKEADERIQ